MTPPPSPVSAPRYPAAIEIRNTSGVNSRFDILIRFYYLGSMITVRPAVGADADAIWGIVEPIIRAGETYTLPREMTREQALAYWHSPGHEVFAAEDNGAVVGTYYLHANQKGGGAHVANCGYMTATRAS